MAFYNYTVYFALIKHICHHNISCIHYAQNDWKKANNALKIRAYKKIDKVYDIYKNGQLSHRSVLRWVVKLKQVTKYFKDVNFTYNKCFYFILFF